MKYAKELDGVLQTCRVSDRLLYLIPYRQWKKRGRPGPLWKLRILLYLLATPIRLLHVNLKTAYKICKRFEKRFGTDGARDFYTAVSKIVSSDARRTDLLKD